MCCTLKALLLPNASKIESLAPTKCIELQGMLKGDDLSAAYASADIFMMPSETETLGFVAMEAMSSGLPVVAVAAGGLVDIMKDRIGETGAPAMLLYISPISSLPMVALLVISLQFKLILRRIHLYWMGLQSSSVFGP